VTALAFHRVWKSYPRWPSGTRTVRALVTRRMPLLGRSGRTWALSDVSFDVPAGGSLGIIGPNGAGKSTLLRLAAGLGRATRGAIDPPEDAAAVLSLGDILDPKLSGRENALTGALVDGWSLDEAKRLLGPIAEYAELEEQFDAPVRTYSDGMRVRLAFAVIAQARPGVLLVDEVISVGDLAFQARCAATIREMRGQGTTLVLASHDLGLVERECEQALWLDHGEPRMLGPAAEVVATYREAAHARVVEETPPPAQLGGRLELRRDRVGTQQLTIDSVAIEPPVVGRGAGATFTLELTNHGKPVTDPIVEVKVARADDDALCFHTTTRDSATALGRVSSGVTVSLGLERVDLLPGVYTVDVAVYSADWETTFDYHWHGYEFTVAGEAPSRGLLAPPQRWSSKPR
jgi:homopolymeric O-antigen transport system ATP-binding protein